jgi:hypothetical protein
MSSHNGEKKHCILQKILLNIKFPCFLGKFSKTDTDNLFSVVKHKFFSNKNLQQRKRLRKEASKILYVKIFNGIQ